MNNNESSSASAANSLTQKATYSGVETLTSPAPIPVSPEKYSNEIKRTPPLVKTRESASSLELGIPPESDSDIENQDEVETLASPAPVPVSPEKYSNEIKRTPPLVKTRESASSLELGVPPESGSDIENLDLVRKILLGDQVRKAEKQQATLERQFHSAVEELNKEMQKQLRSMRKDIEALERETSDLRHDLLGHIEQTERQVQQNTMDRHAVADLLKKMAGRLTDRGDESGTPD